MPFITMKDIMEFSGRGLGAYTETPDERRTIVIGYRERNQWLGGVDANIYMTMTPWYTNEDIDLKFDLIEKAFNQKIITHSEAVMMVKARTARNLKEYVDNKVAEIAKQKGLEWQRIYTTEPEPILEPEVVAIPEETPEELQPAVQQVEEVGGTVEQLDRMAQYNVRITSNASDSMFNPANSINKIIKIKTNMNRPDGTPYFVNVSLDKLMAKKPELDRQRDIAKEAIEEEPYDVISQSALFNRVKRGQIPGTVNYTGFGIMADHATGHMNMEQNRIRGKIELFFGEKLLGSIPYFFRQNNLIGLDLGDMTVGSGAMSLYYSKDPVDRNRRFKKTGLDITKSLFTDIYYRTMPGTVVDQLKYYNSRIYPTFMYTPILFKTIEKYYNTTDPAELFKEGYTNIDDPNSILNPDKEAMNRTLLGVQFPINKAENEWNRWVGGQNDYITNKVNDSSPASYSDITRIMMRTPITGEFMIRETDLKKAMAVLQNNGASLLEMAEVFKNITGMIEAVEIQAFNYSYYCYIAEGNAPSTMVERAMKAYNKRLLEAQARKEKWAIFETLIGLTLSTVSLGMGTAFMLARQTTQVRQATSQVEAIKEETEQIQEAVDVTEEKIQEFHEVMEPSIRADRDYEGKKSFIKKMALPALGTALVAGTALLMD